ncbi:uncharacterized protein LOC130621979 [Hydractinia symbiolongicarpus]|uniref:uncharacterized protein LOC130621979 n=1 Tax=Hydractinia symbiolongicarpus TaxID=13093 RepID=UPI00254B6DDA|nr:uncharacterized protein LOC130621979 [Hydractinia symbiolongicarpus]
MANRQLRSEVLKRALKACIVQPVIRKYQVVAVRAMWGSDVDAREVIWGKRMQMENILLSNEQVSCFFSCITYMARPRKRKSMRNEGEEEEEADSSSEGDNRNGANAPETFPGISFWIACDLPNCTLSQFETNLSKSFMQAGLNLTTCNAIQTRGKYLNLLVLEILSMFFEYFTPHLIFVGKTSALQAFSGSLYQVLKDHNREEAKRIVEISHRTMIRSAARDEGVQLDHVAVMESEQYSMKPCQLILTKNIDKEVYQDVIRGLSEIRFTSLDLKVIDKSEGTEVTIPVKPTNKLCQSVDIVRRMMERNSFGLCNGGVYKKIGESRYTYVYCCSVKSYLYRSLKNKAIANEITPNLRELVFLLSDGECQIIDHITLDYNYIECLPNGVCYNIAKKCFDIKPNLKGSPRAFVRYFHREGKNPEPKPFIEGVENSFPDRNVQLRFYQKWYQILLAGQYPMKEKKLLLVGPPDSGNQVGLLHFKVIK